VELFRGGGAGIVPGIGIACHGPVESVKLFTRVAPAAIGRVQVDKASRTSVALLRILLADLYDVRPDFNAGEPLIDELLKREEAALVIGDACFAAERRFRAEGAMGEGGKGEGGKGDGVRTESARGETTPAVQCLDLGLLWQKDDRSAVRLRGVGFGRAFVQRAQPARRLV